MKTVGTEKSQKAAAGLEMGIRRTQNTRATIPDLHPPTPTYSGEGPKNPESGKVPVPHSPPTLTTLTSCPRKSA